VPVSAVFDTNILVSALLSLHGAPFRCLALAKVGVVQSITCAEILDEFERVLVSKIAYAAPQARAAADEVRRCSRLVTIAGTLKTITDDPDDDKVLECAVLGGASHIVTGDRRHLLPLGVYRGIVIVSAADFLALAAPR
jgi:putative PIN family toxin of toxin-antitoxin system